MSDLTPNDPNYDPMVELLLKEAAAASTKAAPPINFIDSFIFGKMVIQGKEFSADLVIVPQADFSGTEYKVLPKWWRPKGHEVTASDVAVALSAHVKLLIIGTGEKGRVRVRSDAASLIKRAGIELVAAPTPEAVKIFNERAGGVRTAAALHLSC